MKLIPEKKSTINVTTYPAPVLVAVLAHVLLLANFRCRNHNICVKNQLQFRTNDIEQMILLRRLRLRIESACSIVYLINQISTSLRAQVTNDGEYLPYPGAYDSTEYRTLGSFTTTTVRSKPSVPGTINIPYFFNIGQAEAPIYTDNKFKIIKIMTMNWAMTLYDSYTYLCSFFIRRFFSCRFYR